MTPLLDASMGNAVSRTEDFAGVLPSSQPTAKPNSTPPPDRQLDARVEVTEIYPLTVPTHCIASTEPTTDRFVVPESVRKARTLDEFVGVCSEILDGFLFVSGIDVAQDAAKLDALEITHVVNCCCELRESAGVVDKRTRLNLALRDDTREDLLPFLPQIVAFIVQSRQQDPRAKVLVHCHQGVSRSCAIAIAVVMATEALPFRAATALVKTRRAISSPNAAFLCQLLEWERELEDERVIAGGRLLRLTPHSATDPHTLVLKRCVSGEQMAIATGEDETRWLWSRGLFVFQRPTAAPNDVVVWRGKQCEMSDDDAAIVAALVDSMASIKAKFKAARAARSDVVKFEVSPILVTITTMVGEGSDADHFCYVDELSWRSVPKAPVPSLLEPENQTADGAEPLLFMLEDIEADAWEQLSQYDAEDLTTGEAFLLVHRSSINFVWFGGSCPLSVESVTDAARRKAIELDAASAEDLVVERQGDESDRFWQTFELGY